MASYHTSIEINAPVEKVWAELMNIESYPAWNPLVKTIQGDLKQGNEIKIYIIPLKSNFKAKLTVFQSQKEMTWLGAVGAKWIVCGEHYYRLEAKGDKTLLLHGEEFKGILSYLIPPFITSMMKKTFEKHNQILKQRIENGK
ncbi:MAG: SRPBCC domain-containing protein [Raineya sp.]|jgi:hypothetical protein|nr:SRPBCC domain-containing protein [Raineya sp.]